MSSWIIAKNNVRKKLTVPITQYHDTSMSSDIPSIYMETIAAFIYSQKMGETCSIWDPTKIISTTLKNNPQIKLLKERPEAPGLNANTSILASMKFKDIQKIAATLLEYTPVFTRSVMQVVEKTVARQTFDIGLHIPGNDISRLSTYSDNIKAYQVKTKKTNLSIYLMTDSYEIVKAFQQIGLPSWKIVSLSRNSINDPSDNFIRMMADVHVMTTVPALILDFNESIDRLIYLIHTGLVFFKEIKDQQWHLL